MSDKKGDFAFKSEDTMGMYHEMTYGGALSFLRRKYSQDLNGVDVAVSGVPFDNAVTYRPGCRLGPRAIRQASVQLAELDAFPFGFNLYENLSIVDYGDCHLDPHHPETIVKAIQDHASKIISQNTKMLTFGGDHFISYPLLKSHAEKYGPVTLIQFDAHCDTWEDSGGMDHGSMFARAVSEGVIDSSKSTQIGLRTYNNSDHGFEILTSPWVHRNGIDAALEIIKNRAGDSPVYISWDIDGFDPSCAPGTGTPVVGGLATWQGLELLRGLESLDLIGMDIVEVSPAYDVSEITAIAAATIGHDFLCILAKKKGAKGNIIGRI